MLSGADFNSKITKTMLSFLNIEAKKEGGENNLVVDGAGNGNITTEADDSVILIADGDDELSVASNLNQIELQGPFGINNVAIAGSQNITTSNTSTNEITSQGNQNIFSLKNGNNDLYSEGNNNIILADTGDNVFRSGGNNNTILTKNGNNYIQTGGDNNTVGTVNGNNTVYSSGYNKATHSFVGEGNYNTIVTGSGRDYISSAGNHNIIDAGNDNNTVLSKGSDNEIYAGNGQDYISSLGDRNTIDSGDNNDKILSNGTDNEINSGNGSDAVLSLGDRNKIDLGEGNNNLVFNGNNINIFAANGNNSISTLDFAIMNQNTASPFNYMAYGNVLESNTTFKEESITDGVDYDYREISREDSDVKPITESTPDLMQQISDADKTYINTYGPLDFTQTVNGNPKYIIAKGKSDNLYHIYVNSGSANSYRAIAGFNGLDGNGARNYNTVASGNGYLTISNGVWGDIQKTTTTYTKTTTVKTEKTTTTHYTDRITTTIKGLENINIRIGTGSNNMNLNVANNISIDGQTLQKAADGSYINNNPKTYNNIFVTGEIVSVNDTARDDIQQETLVDSFDVEVDKQVTRDNLFLSSGYSTSSPLIVDFNKDGRISAKAGIGVDIDNNGIADGAASGGDKMLAMTDFNGNGNIDGTEVFGNNTVSPFTHEKLNAANGFEALKLVAQEAQDRGFNCISANGEVNLANLREALKTVGVNLGFISDTNTSELEDFGHIVSINVSDYTEQNEIGDIQHNQMGSYTDNEGNKFRTDDVWFRRR